MNHGRNNADIGEDLKVGLQQIVAAELVVDQEKQVEDVPEDDDHAQVLDRIGVGDIGSDNANGSIRSQKQS